MLSDRSMKVYIGSIVSHCVFYLQRICLTDSKMGRKDAAGLRSAPVDQYRKQIGMIKYSQ